MHISTSDISRLEVGSKVKHNALLWIQTLLSGLRVAMEDKYKISFQLQKSQKFHLCLMVG